MPEATPARRLAAALLAAIGLVAPDARACGGDWIVADVIDGDTLRIVNPALPPPLDALSLRLLGVDAPETGRRARCPAEAEAAGAATAFVRRVLARADTVSVVLARWGKWGARVLAAVSAKHLGMLTIPDGVTTLLAAGDNDQEGHRAFQTLAKRYPGKRIVAAAPPTGVKDYNDLLRGHGPAAVKAHLRGRCRAAR